MKHAEKDPSRSTQTRREDKRHDKAAGVVVRVVTGSRAIIWDQGQGQEAMSEIRVTVGGGVRPSELGGRCIHRLHV